VLRPQGEATKISLVQVKVFQEVRSIEKLELLTTDGKLIATLFRRVTANTTDYKQTFDAIIQPEDQIAFPADTDTMFVLRAVVKTIANAGFSEELLQVRTFNVTHVGIDSNQAINTPFAGPFPKHQTSFGRITSVTSVSPLTASAVSGTGVTLGSFAFSGSVDSTRSLAVSQLTFTLQKTGDVTLQNLLVRNPETGITSSCSLNVQTMTIFCPNLSSSTGKMSRTTPLVLDVIADLTVSPNQTGVVSIGADLVMAGSPESIGAVEWTDTSGSFRWIESAVEPLARGTRFQ